MEDDVDFNDPKWMELQSEEEEFRHDATDYYPQKFGDDEVAE